MTTPAVQPQPSASRPQPWQANLARLAKQPRVLLHAQALAQEDACPEVAFLCLLLHLSKQQMPSLGNRFTWLASLRHARWQGHSAGTLPKTGDVVLTAEGLSLAVFTDYRTQSWQGVSIRESRPQGRTAPTVLQLWRAPT